MSIDPYSPCPGGTGKKVKFCCPDLVTDLEKLHRILEGEQRAAALELAENLDAKYPDRACLLSIRSMLENQLGQEEKAKATMARFVEKYPGNPVALAESAMLKAEGESGRAGVGPLQDALEGCTEQIPLPVYDAIGVVASALLADNELFAGRAHLMLQLGIGGGRDKGPLEMIVRLNSSQLPLWTKQDFTFLPAPDDALWKASFTKSMDGAYRGTWRRTANELTDLAARSGDWPPLWHNIAVLRTWLADNSGAIAAWRKYAEGNVPLDDGVEALAIAQLLDPDGTDTVDVLTVRYGVSDPEALLARLMANSRSPQMPIDLAQLAGENEPPPKGAFWLLDRPVPTSGRDLTRQTVPRVVGQVFVFGKQTDRAARVELVVYRSELSEAESTLAEVTGDALGPRESEEVTTQVSLLQHVLSWNWRLPEDTPPELRLSLMADERKDILLNRWPELPQKALGGKGAREAAADPKTRNAVLATILLLEQSTDRALGDFDFNDLRASLNLPRSETIDPTQVKVAELPLVRWPRIDVKKLSDEDLVQLYRRAELVRHYAALRILGPEVISRPSLEGKVQKDEVHGMMAQIEPDIQDALAHLDAARAAAEASKKTTAPWDLAELAMRIARGEVAEADRLLHHIRDQHIREPGVAQALFQILSEAGIIGPDGKPTAAAQAAAPGIVVPGAAPAESSKIWTPGSDQPAPGGSKKSALWTPGME